MSDKPLRDVFTDLLAGPLAGEVVIKKRSRLARAVKGLEADGSITAEVAARILATAGRRPALWKGNPVEGYVTAPEAGRIMGVSREWAASLCRLGKFPSAWRWDDRMWLVSIADVATWPKRRKRCGRRPRPPSPV